MTQQEIQERNKQIAIMLGWKNSFAKKVDQYGYYQTVDGYSTPYANTLDEQVVEYQQDKNAFAIEDLQFHSDWNWLMEAVEFMKNLDLSEFNYHVGKMTLFKVNKDVLKKMPITSKKESIFLEVSDFAKLYNKEL